jgi:deferrochelatase/peroxidase EfeB
MTSRRLFLGSAGALAGAGAARAQVVPSRPEVAQGGAEPFYGAHQAGITSPMQDSLYFASFDLAAGKREDVVALLRTWTNAAALLTAGLPAENDSGEAVGLAPARLTLTFGFGPDMFVLDGVDRYGIASKRPAALADLPRFAGDELVAGRCGGAICIQACANDAQVAFHAVRQLARLAYGAAELKWVQSGFSTANKTQGTPRNLMGFKDGTMNPTANEAPAVVWANSADWMNGGTYMVARRIRIALEHWDRMKIAFQEQTFGRQKVSGAPLGAKKEFDAPDFSAADADGNYVIPETSHVRLAAPVNNDGTRILRRSYSYNEGANFVAERWPPWRQGIEYDSGLFFQAYQQDPRTGFVKLFEKMSKIDALNQFTTHVGSAVFACPPGVRAGGYLGEGLFGV